MGNWTISKPPILFVSALLLTFAIPAFGYFYLGKLYGLLFFLGYGGGFVLWILIPRKARYESIKVAYWAAFLTFVLLHKTEENATKFFEVVSEKITGDALPEVTPLLIVALLVLPVGLWLATPFLIKRCYDFGYYLGWTFFASMGITELAHFVLPLLVNAPYGYFPGMASVVVLSPLAWWGMWRLARG